MFGAEVVGLVVLACEPGGALGHVVVAGQVDVLAVLNSIE